MAVYIEQKTLKALYLKNYNLITFNLKHLIVQCYKERRKSNSRP